MFPKLEKARIPDNTRSATLLPNVSWKNERAIVVLSLSWRSLGTTTIYNR
jgi:hypothetical protein